MLSLVTCIASYLHEKASTSGEDEFAEKFKCELLLEQGYINLNHGSFGVCPRSLVQRKMTLLEQAEKRPDDWYRVR